MSTTVKVKKRNVAVSVILSVLTLGIYANFWAYRLIQNTYILKKKRYGAVFELLGLLFVPLYAYYWWYSRGRYVKKCFAEYGQKACFGGAGYLMLALFGMPLVSMAIMQHDFNALPFDSVEIALPFSEIYTVPRSNRTRLAALVTMIVLPLEIFTAGVPATPREPIYVTISADPSPFPAEDPFAPEEETRIINLHSRETNGCSLPVFCPYAPQNILFPQDALLASTPLFKRSDESSGKNDKYGERKNES